MKLLLLTGLILLFPLQQQTPQTVEREESDLTVVKFNWSKYRPNNDLISSVTDPGPALNEPVSLKQPERRNEHPAAANRRDIQERRAALRNAERNAGNSTPRRQDYYMMRLEVKNIGQSTTKSIVWEFQPAVQTPDYEIKQYICKIKTKPNESKSFELMTPAAPVKVVSADKKSQEGKVVINRIEYADGTVWKRKGWSVLIPAEMTDHIANGKCMMF